VKAASFVVLTGTTMPAILAEVSFVSSPPTNTICKIRSTARTSPKRSTVAWRVRGQLGEDECSQRE